MGKVIQIAFDAEDRIYALCADGSIWVMHDDVWHEIETPDMQPEAASLETTRNEANH